MTNRPNAIARYAAPPTANPTQWLNFKGYDTYLTELCKIFDVNVGTVSARLRGGWPLEVALVAPSRGCRNPEHAAAMLREPWVHSTVQRTLDAYFKPTKKKRK